MGRAAGRVVGIEDGFDRVVLGGRGGDGGLDAVGDHLGDFAVEELAAIGAAGAAEQAAVQPLADDAFHLAEEVELRRLARIAVAVLQDVVGDFEDDRRFPNILEMLDAEIRGFADDPLPSAPRSDRRGQG